MKDNIISNEEFEIQMLKHQKRNIMSRIIEIKDANYKQHTKEYNLITNFIELLLDDKEIKELAY